MLTSTSTVLLEGLDKYTSKAMFPPEQLADEQSSADELSATFTDGGKSSSVM